MDSSWMAKTAIYATSGMCLTFALWSLPLSRLPSKVKWIWALSRSFEWADCFVLWGSCRATRASRFLFKHWSFQCLLWRAYSWLWLSSSSSLRLWASICSREYSNSVTRVIQRSDWAKNSKSLTYLMKSLAWTTVENGKHTSRTLTLYPVPSLKWSRCHKRWAGPNLCTER